MPELRKEEGRWSAGRVIYASLMAFLLLGYFYTIATYSEPTYSGKQFTFPILFWVLRGVTAVMAIYMGKLWKNKGFLLLSAFWLLLFLRVFLENPANLFLNDISEYLLTGLWAFAGCYGLAEGLGEKQLKQFLGLITAIWTVGMVVYSGIGLYAAWTDQRVYTIGRNAIFGLYWENRLFLAYYETVSGAVLSLSAVIAVCGMLAAGHKWAKVLYGLAALPMLVALSLTGTRAAQITVSLGFGVAVLIGVLHLFKGKKDGRRSKAAWPAAVCAMALVAALSLCVALRMVGMFNHMKNTGGILVARAMAESAGVEIAERGLDLGNLEGALNSRPLVWRTALRVLSENKKLWLTGTSVHSPMTGINAYLGWWTPAAHCHNTLIQVLLESGLPGLLLILLFVLLLTVRAFRLVVSTDKPLWRKLAVAVMVSLWLGEMVECFLWLHADNAPMLPAAFVVMGIVSTSGKRAGRQPGVRGSPLSRQNP